MDTLTRGATPTQFEKAAPLVKRLAALFALTVACTLPGGYFALRYTNLSERADTIAELKAGAIEALATATPDLWMFQSHRLEDLLHNNDKAYAIALTIRDAAGNPVIAIGAAPPAPLIMRSHAMHESGRLIGQVDVVLSYRDVLIGTFLAGLFGLILGGAVYGVTLILPLRALRRMSAALDKERAALRNSEERYLLLFKTNPVPLWVFDEATLRFLAVNDATVAKYGWSRDEFLAMTVKEIRRAEDVQFLITQLSQGREERFVAASKHRTKDGALIDVEIRSHRIEFDGRFARIVSAYDITERTRAETELRKNSAFLRLLLEAIPVPVFYKDAALRYTGCNSAYTRFIGKSAGEIVGKTVFDVAPASLAPIYSKMDTDLLHGPSDHQIYETQVMHADGTLHDVIFHKARMQDDYDAPTGIIGAIADITEIRRMATARDLLQAQLRESQKMEALGTLAGGVAHDFNNIVATISGNVNLARSDLASEHPAQENLHEIFKASQRAKDLVQQILAFGRRQPLERKVISIEPAIRESENLLRAALPAGIRLNIVCAPDVPAVLADAHQIQQLLINLCTNAWQAMRARGTGTIEVRLREHARTVDEDSDAPTTLSHVHLAPGRYACLSVRDDGPGMDTATRARIFEPFFTTKPVGEGTGLGLSVVHGIVEQHEASIEVRSTPGDGAMFRIYFPAAEAAPRHTVNTQQSPGSGNLDPAQESSGEGKQILYVDDDDAMVLLVTRLLERRGYRVSGYTDAREAVAAARAAPVQFDLAVTDYNMPQMSGLDVARELKRINAGLPVAIITGYITDELRASAPAAGVSELIYKPNSVEELSETIARLAHPSDGQATH